MSFLNKRWWVLAGIIPCIAFAAMLRAPSTPDFSQYDAGPQRKAVFIDHFAPLIAQENNDIQDSRGRALELQERSADLGFFERRFIHSLAKSFALEDFDIENPQHWEVLLKRVDTVPVSLALAQAANESGWGTSRFAKEGNNYFGQWCFQAGCGLVPRNRETGKVHEVAKFSSASDSVKAYVNNLNTSDAYANLRSMRAQQEAQGKTVSGRELAKGLLNYSERGQEYVNDIQSMIAVNALEQYDTGHDQGAVF